MTPPPLPLRADVDYLTPPRDHWWRWSQDQQWIEWADGRSIVARPELQHALEHLAQRGLPPLDAILLVIAATRERWDAERSATLILNNATLESIGTNNAGIQLFDSITNSRVATEVTETLDALSRIALLPAKYLSTAAAKAKLLDLIFQEAPESISTESSASVVTLLDQELELHSPPVRPMSRLRRLEAALNALRLGLERATEVDLERWISAGIDADVQPAPIDVPPSRRVRELLAGLRGDEELGPLAVLALRLLAALHVPRNLQAHEELPLGGVSDISNRGSLDRLLISELVHDDLTLAVRVAMNEALYVRREAPASHPPIARTVVLDSGIRMWGVPRLFGAAVALSLVASSDPQATCEIVRTQRAGTIQAELTTAQGVKNLLAALDPWPNPAEAFARHVQALRQAGPDAKIEAFLITERSALDDESLSRQLSKVIDQADVYVATVANDGAFELILISPLGRRVICSAQLNLDGLLDRPTKRSTTQTLLDRDLSLPLILRLERFPLRLPTQVNVRQAIYLPEVGLIGLAGDGRLLRWTSDRIGAEQLADHLPPGVFRGIYADPSRDCIYVVLTRKKQSKLVLYRYSIESGESSVSEITTDLCREIVFNAGVFLLMQRTRFSVLNPESLHVATFELPPQCRLLNSRFYVGESGSLHVASATGLHKASGIRRHVTAAFDYPGKGPWVASPPLRLEAADGREQFPALLNHGIPNVEYATLYTSADGERLLFYRSHTREGLGLILASTKTQHLRSEEESFSFLLGDAIRWSHAAGIALHKNFSAIGRTSRGEVALLGRHGWRSVSVEDDKVKLVTVPNQDVPQVSVRFSQRTPLDKTGIRLKAASWSNGACAWLDSRGLLHLKSSNKRLPEVTCILNESGVSGWMSDGTTFGWRYFFDADPTLTTAQAAGVIRAIAEDWR